jgi:hypothetical protein
MCASQIKGDGDAMAQANDQRPRTKDFSMRQILLGQPELQVALFGWPHLQEANSHVAQFVDPGNFALNF